MLCQVMGKGVAFATNFIFARMLGPSLLGNYYLGITLLTITSSVAAMGLPKGALRYVVEFRARKEKENIRSIIYISILLGLSSSIIFMLIIFFFRESIAVLFPNANVALILRYLFWLLPFSILLPILTEILRGCRQFTVIIFGQSFLWAVLILCSFLVIAFFSSDKMNTGHAFLAYIIGTVSIFLIYVVTLRKWLLNNTKSRAYKYNEVHITKNLVKTSLPLLIVSASSMLLTWTDTIMLGSLLDSKDVGIYGAALRIAILISFILGAINSVIPTLIGENYHSSNRGDLQCMLRTICTWLVYLVIPLLIIFINFPKEIMTLFGTEFGAGYMVLVVLSLSQFINVFFGPVGYLLMMSGYERALSGITVACGLLNVLGNWILIPKIGILGAAISTGGTLVLQNLFMASVALKQMKIKATPKAPWFIAGIVLIMALISFVLKDYKVTLRIISAGVELLIGGVLILKCVIDDSDKRLVANVLKQVGIN
ncbi:Polysaccharide biosynthesis protein [Dissulfuribacter thermophilus]|uniref:Polysaccharide biosynthesis protein n=2 Tax=Dissulfuribacter thermophilus TaxID=1156395 RepID=A0A1B9F490_9BACT|nr:Polysaccharide biosynthesis protein [Dissulfuribacter thermophilus]